MLFTFSACKQIIENDKQQIKNHIVYHQLISTHKIFTTTYQMTRNDTHSNSSWQMYSIFYM